jgi:predicted HicB family RNase H-like nuclease
MMDAEKYSISIKKVKVEGEVFYEAKVKEFPDIAEYAETFEEAYSFALDSINTTYEYFQEKGKSFPAPYVANEDYSGRVTLRVSRTLHRFLAESSDEEGVSLNQHIVNVLTYYSGVYANTSKSLDWLVPDGIKSQKFERKSIPKASNLRLVHTADRALTHPDSLGWR